MDQHLDANHSSNDSARIRDHVTGTNRISHGKVGKPRRFECTICEQSFGRVEHLTRHEKSHSKEGWLRCASEGCGKGFYRIDALRRHELVHKEPKRSALGRGARACSACAIARRKCSGGNPPCAACEKRSIECRFPYLSRTTNSSSRYRVQNRSSVDSHGRIEGERNQSGDQDMASPQDSQLSWPTSLLGSRMNENASIDRFGNGLGLNNLDVGSQHVGVQPLGSNIHQHYNSSFAPHNNNMNTNNTMNTMSEDIRRASNASHIQQNPSTSLMPLHSMIDINEATNSLLMRTAQSSSTQTQSSNHSISAPLTDNSASWAQYSLSSINWLPYDWVPDYQVEGSELRLLDERTGIDDFSPVNATDIQTRRNYTYPNDIFMSSPQTQSQPIDDSPRPTISTEGVPEISSPNSYDAQQSTGRYYVDGHGSRLPHIRKAPSEATNPSTSISTLAIDDQEGSFTFPDSDENDEHVASTNCKQLPQEIYNDILDMFEQTCINPSPYFQPFHNLLPTLPTLSCFIAYYIDSFHQTMPFIHLPSFSISNSHWLFLLAMASIGSQYHHNVAYSRPMHEFLRRAIFVVSSQRDKDCENMVLIQVKLLNCVGMMYSGCEDLFQASKAHQRDLIGFCEREWRVENCMRGKREAEEGRLNDSDCVNRDWRAWYRAEGIRRTGYCIWLLDCMWAFHFQLRPSLSLDDASVILPCQEVLWEASTAMEWHQLLGCSIPHPSLHTALQQIYTSKRLQSSTGEFSRILLIHGLFRRTWEVEFYLSQPLTQWTPVAETQNQNPLTSQTPTTQKQNQITTPLLPTEKDKKPWLPGIPLYSKWRNSACDCLDILHWHANSVIGAASGMEHPTVLHLHAARVVLLTPFREILKLAEFLVEDSQKSQNSQNSNGEKGNLQNGQERREEERRKEEIRKLKEIVKRWATEDQHKARLAIIHAGALFWHVRRFSIDAFYEASAVYLATLALWAYGSFADGGGFSARKGESGKENNEGNGNGSGKPNKDIERNVEGEEEEEIETLYNPTSMQLDRPADDELVQLFVKRGAKMKALVMGVGDLCAGKGPKRVLGEGRKLLVGGGVGGRWGVKGGRAELLRGLGEVV